MTKEEAKQTLERISQINGPIFLCNYLEAIDIAIDVLSQPSLPSNLDEAAKKYGTEKHPMTTIGANESAYDFKTGAEWMAGQGITVTGDTDDEYVRILKDIEKAICKIAPDGIINVQIRK